MKNIFIAGGAGYIGSACSEYMLDHGYQAIRTAEDGSLA